MKAIPPQHCLPVLALMLLLCTAGTFAQTIVGVYELPNTNYNNAAYGLTSDSNSVWLSSGTSSTGTGDISEFSLDGALLGTISTGTGTSQGLAWTGSHFWYFFRGNSSTSAFYKVTPTGTIVDTILTGTTFIGGCYWDGEGLWYSLYFPNDEAAIYKLDVNTGTVVDTIETIGGQPQGITWDGQYFYYAMDDNDGDPERIYIYDPVIQDTVGAIPISDPISTRPRGLAWDGQHLWLVADPVGTPQRALFKFDLGGSGTPNINVPTASFNFGNVQTATTGSGQIGIQNAGDAPLTIAALSTTGAEFDVSTATPIVLAPNESAVVDISFTPTNYGFSTGTLQIASDDPANPLVVVDLRGVGLLPDPTIFAGASSHNFGNVWVGADGIAAWTLTLANRGISSLEIQALTLSTAAFSTAAPPLPFVVTPDDTVEITVFFEPPAPGGFNDLLQIASNDPNMPQLDIALSGAGDGGPFGLGNEFWQYNIPDNPNGSSFQDRGIEAIRSIGDITGDGINDVIYSTENYLTACLDGASANQGIPLWTFNTGLDNNNTGSISLNGLFSAQKAMQVASDLNGDCINDVIIGTDGGNEHVYAIDGSNGQELWSFGSDIDPGLGGFGAVDVARDFNGDLTPDVLAVASSNSTGGGYKSVFLFNGNSGQQLWRYQINVPGTASGYSVISIPDLNGDGIPDAVAGYGGDGATRFARGIDGATGFALWEYAVPEGGAKDLLPLAVPNETPDVIVAAFDLSNGALFRVDGESGIQIWRFNAGGSVIEMTLLPDINGDGFEEVLIVDFGPSRIACVDGQTGTLLYSVPTTDYRGYSVVVMPDLNGDQIHDAAGCDQDGNLYIFSGVDGTIIQTVAHAERLQSLAVSPSIDGNDSFELLVGMSEPSGGVSRIFSYSGGVDASTVIRKGDIDFDLQVSQCDAQLVMDNRVGLLPLTGADSSAADVSRDGTLSAFDAAQIIRFFSGRIDSFETQSPAQLDVNVSLPDTVLEYGETAALPLRITALDGQDVFSFEFTVAYDPALVSALAADSAGAAAAGFDLFSESVSPGIVRVAGATRDEATGDGTLLHISFTAGQSPGLSSLSFSNFRLNEGNPAAIVSDGSIAVVKQVGIDDPFDSGLPTSFALHQNYPNPFNPTTLVRFDLPESATVTLTVHDLLGRELLNIIDGQRFPAGRHQSTIDGSSLSSGVYFYRVQAGAFVGAQKMILLK